MELCNMWCPKVVCFFLLCGIISGQQLGQRLSARRHHRGVRYPGLGFFSISPPFNNTNWLPQRPSFINTTFALYTGSHAATPETLNPDQSSSITTSSFDAALPVKILVHGFLQYQRSPFLLDTTRALLALAPMNVIVVGWGGGAGFPYGQAVANTRVVGAEIAKLIKALVEVKGISARHVHIIGHSLGAHIAGYAGSRTTGLGRITALDPAQPSYRGFGPVVRLDTTDARFVDVIHTDAIPYDTVGGYGMIDPVGHLDFYPNGGHHQPGCFEESSIMSFMQDAWNRGVSVAESGLSCSHERSTQLFIDSITRPHSPCEFRAFPCDSEEQFMRGECLHCGNRPCPLMGYHADKSFGVRGTFYLNTTASEPFCGHPLFVTVTLASPMSAADGTISVQIRGSRGQSTITPITSSSGEYSAGGVYTGMILGENNLGDISEVDVRFVQESSYLWGTQRVTLRKVEVNNVMRMPPKYFCQSAMTISSGGGITLSGGSFTQGSCP